MVVGDDHPLFADNHSGAERVLDTLTGRGCIAPAEELGIEGIVRIRTVRALDDDARIDIDDGWSGLTHDRSKGLGQIGLTSRRLTSDDLGGGRRGREDRRGRGRRGQLTEGRDRKHDEARRYRGGQSQEHILSVHALGLILTIRIGRSTFIGLSPARALSGAKKESGRKQGADEAVRDPRRPIAKKRPPRRAALFFRRCPTRSGGFGLGQSGQTLAIRSALGFRITINKLDHRERRVVPMTETSLQNPRISALTILVAIAKHGKQLLNQIVFLERRRGLPASCEIALLAEGDQLIDHRAKLLGLGQGRRDLLMTDQSAGHVGEHRLTMLVGSIEFAKRKAVAHDDCRPLTGAAP